MLEEKESIKKFHRKVESDVSVTKRSTSFPIDDEKSLKTSQTSKTSCDAKLCRRPLCVDQSTSNLDRCVMSIISRVSCIEDFNYVITTRYSKDNQSHIVLITYYQNLYFIANVRRLVLNNLIISEEHS